MNSGEHHLMNYIMGLSGDFYTALFRCLVVADSVNFEKLERGFPEEAKAFHRWRTEKGYSDFLMKEWKILTND